MLLSLAAIAGCLDFDRRHYLFPGDCIRDENCAQTEHCEPASSKCVQGPRPNDGEPSDELQPGECTPGQRECRSGAPFHCEDGGTWHAEASCGSSTPVCRDGQCLGCQPGNGDCDGRTPRLCDDGGVWMTQPTCGGATPVCNAGRCAVYVLRGGIEVLGVGHDAAGPIWLRGGRLEELPRTCGTSLCVRGGIVP